MAYAAWTVVAGEQPTASKWNILGTNDQSFNDGSGFSITTTGVIPGLALTTSAIKLGYAEITSNFVPGTTAETDITNVAVTVSVPAGGRDLLITAKLDVYNTGGADDIVLKIKESTTVLQTAIHRVTAANKADTVYFSARLSAPSSGSHTYKTSIAGSLANPAVQATATETAYILAQAI